MGQGRPGGRSGLVAVTSTQSESRTGSSGDGRPPAGAADLGADCAREVLERERRAHLRALERHEQAAQTQAGYGRPDRARAARQHADHTRQLLERNRQEQRELEQRIAQLQPDDLES
jgi:hypothetical protein